MVIAQSNVAFASSHLSVEMYQKSESLKAWVGDPPPDAQKPATVQDRVDLSGQTPPVSQQAEEAQGPATEEEKLEPKYLLLKRLIERFLKTSIKLLDAEELKGAAAAPGQTGTAPGQAVAAAHRPAQQTQPAGYGVDYNMTQSVFQYESTSFAASGMIKTADGQEINFNLSLSMERAYLSQTSVSMQAGDAVRKDPLVVNFDGTAAELTSTRFAFDLEGDGTAEEVAAPESGSGFLVLDKNGDGTVNDGGELFGPQTGNGFAELGTYDADRNGWIDENDGVYNQLGIWSGGESPLQTLKEAGVGAIYLANQATPFDLKNAENQLLGAVKSSGIFVKEDGGVGTVQQVDLAV